MPLVVVMEDDAATRTLVASVLRKEGYDVLSADNGISGLELVRQNKPDLVISDVQMPLMDGFAMLQALRADPALLHTPVVLLTSLQERAHMRIGMTSGADDYITKPFSPKELVARAGAVLRRVRPALAAETLDYAGVEMDLTAHRVRRDDKSVRLGPTEYRLLRHFLENPGRVFSRQQLLETVWPHSEDIELRTVDVHIRRLRLALGEPDLVRTVRSAGYALDSDSVN